ncbi:hypothetical protein UAJ10_22775 [Nitrospirillum sp. BR 11164]|uniref:hypothetical protein n=1 Tax=Nitrospirillum sp. BR 11164 TaxID=3104324 RepID=UPI002AFE20CA|nr:hypothetical protein [Nitrospirillum sp. BR 11164]MEA1651825.1 hypothetical protein [Nitrospirillum sp. BR 11164]
MMRKLSGFHDAELIGVGWDPVDATLTLEFLSEGRKEKKVMKFSGVAEFRLVDFINQNVVHDIKILSGQDEVAESVTHFIKWMLTLSDRAEFSETKEIDDYVSKIKKGDILLCVLNPSWGCDAVVAAREYEVL